MGTTTVRYPLVFAHGLAMTDNAGSYPCWGRVPEALRAQRIPVYLGGQDAWGTIETNAEQLAAVVKQAMERENAPKVNLIAHSKGGLEARYLISSRGFGSCVASLTMLATPHRGARPAEHMFRFPGFRLWATHRDEVNDTHDQHPNTLRAYEQLSAAYLTSFNQENPDDPAVYYQSWGAQLGKNHSDPLMRASARLFQPRADNDGLVTPDSAQWGDYRGTLNSVSHLELVDTYQRDTPAFQPVAFYQKLVQELAEKGF